MKIYKLFKETYERYDIKHKGFLAFCTVLFLLSAINDIVLYQLQGKMSGIVTNLNHNLKSIYKYIFILGAIFLVKIILSALNIYIIGKKNSSVTFELRKRVSNHFAKIKTKAVTQNGIGGLISIVMNELPNVVGFLVDSSMNFFCGVVGVSVAIIYMFHLQPILTCVFLIVFPLATMIQNKNSEPIQKAMGNVSDARSNFNKKASDILYNSSIVSAYSLEDVMEKEYIKKYDHYYQANTGFIKSLIKALCISSIVSKAPIYLLYVISSFLTLKGEMFFGQFITYIIVTEVVSQWLSMIMENMSFLRMKAECANKLNSIMELECDDTDEGEIQLDYQQPAIEFNHVSIGYTDKILDDINIEINRREHIAIIGKSGAGKSSILKTILGLNGASEGYIKVFGNEITEKNIRNIRNLISYVSQDYYIFPISLRDNILPANHTISEDELERACEAVGILDKIKSLPNGFDTIVLDGGANLSGGERQRISLARAYLQNREIILLDEPVSAMDELTASKIQDMIHTHMYDKTVVLVTHRDEVLRDINKIYEIKGGHLNETRI